MTTNILETTVLAEHEEDRYVLQKFEKDGLLFEHEQSMYNGKPEGEGQIVAVSIAGVTPRYRIGLGQLVFANGRYLVENGRLGIVVKIFLSFEEGRTTDILDVHFEGLRNACRIKFKDLDLEQTMKRTCVQ